MKGQDGCHGATCRRLSFSLSVQGRVLRGQKGSQYSLCFVEGSVGFMGITVRTRAHRRTEGLCQYPFVSRGLVSRISGPLPHPTKGLGVSLGSTCQCSIHNVRGSCLWFVSSWTSARCPLCYPRCLTITAPPLRLHFCQSDVFSVTFKKNSPL